MNKEEVRRILQENNVSVKKQYGQNFLLDENVLRNIITNANINKESFVIEIGPGLGFLTNYLSENANNVLCYEIDDEMVSVLNKRKYSNVDGFPQILKATSFCIITTILFTLFVSSNIFKRIGVVI